MTLHDENHCKQVGVFELVRQAYIHIRGVEIARMDKKLVLLCNVAPERRVGCVRAGHGHFPRTRLLVLQEAHTNQIGQCS